MRLSSTLAPKPRSPRMRPASAATLRLSSESTPSSSYSRRARLGPKPGSCMTEISPVGMRARSFWAAGMSPVSSSAFSFSSSVLPMPGSSVTFPWRERPMTDTEASRTALAALR